MHVLWLSSVCRLFLSVTCGSSKPVCPAHCVAAIRQRDTDYVLDGDVGFRAVRVPGEASGVNLNVDVAGQCSAG